ncbi:MAG: hemerythrin family protein [Ignavibacteria bacterium]|nr:hemerythrin family protein [Ignavibacteria bacterium]
MPLYNWDENYSVKIEKIDSQHKQLLQMVNDLFEARQSGKAKEIINSIIQKLTQYTIIHFRDEENLMKIHKYPDFEIHKKEHDMLVKKVGELNEQLNSGSFSLTIEISQFLKEWLVNHILKTDKKYTQFFADRGIK